MLEDYYKTLGIAVDADETALKKAFRRLALKSHPDVNHDPGANQSFQDICEAYEVLLRHIKHKNTVHTDRQEEAGEDNYSYDDVIREAREAAYKRARMRYEKMKAEKDLFEQSGWWDVALLLNYAGRILAIPLVILLIALPVWVAVSDEPGMFFALFFFWIIGGVILLQMISLRKTWFHQGKIRWKFRDLLKFIDFSPVTDTPTADCHYCNGKKADSKPITLTFLKIKDIQISNDGVYQHRVGYKRKYKEIVIPRSVKASKVHFAQSMIKISSMVCCLLFLPFPDFIWRFVFGLFLGIFLSSVVLWISRTRSKVSYLLNYYLVIKICIWMAVIISQSTLYPGFILKSTEYAPFYLIFLVIFGDMTLDLLLKLFPFYRRIYLPIFSQGTVIDVLLKEGYQAYMDVPVWSTLYPLVAWFL